jgi:hypothetical protein
LGRTAEPQFGGLKPATELGFGGTFQRKRNMNVKSSFFKTLKNINYEKH